MRTALPTAAICPHADRARALVRGRDDAHPEGLLRQPLEADLRDLVALPSQHALAVHERLDLHDAAATVRLVDLEREAAAVDAARLLLRARQPCGQRRGRDSALIGRAHD